MLFNSKRNFKDHMMHALVGFFVGAAIMSLLSSKTAEVRTQTPFSRSDAGQLTFFFFPSS